jgi:hypothetical protein
MAYTLTDDDDDDDDIKVELHGVYEIPYWHSITYSYDTFKEMLLRDGEIQSFG